MIRMTKTMAKTKTKRQWQRKRQKDNGKDKKSWQQKESPHDGGFLYILFLWPAAEPEQRAAIEIILQCFSSKAGQRPPANWWINHAHNILNSLPLAARQGKAKKRKDGLHSSVPKSTLSNGVFPQKCPIPGLPMDSNGTFRSVPWNSVRSEAFGLEKSSAVRREAIQAWVDAEASTDRERGRLQVTLISF